MGKSTVEKTGDVIGSALGKALREAKSPPRRSKGALSGMRGVVLGAGLGVLAAKKGAPLVQNAMLRYVTSRATGATDQVPTGATDRVPPTGQAAGASPAA